MVEIKVKDNRIFDEFGELRAEFRHLENEPAPEPTAAPAEPAAAEPPPEPGPRAPLGPAAGQGAPRSGPADPLFIELLGMLAEPAAVFLGDAVLPDGRVAIDLERARLYIDLLETVREKTAGNLNSEEQSVLEDVLYRLRLRYVEKQGRP